MFSLCIRGMGTLLVQEPKNKNGGSIVLIIYFYKHYIVFNFKVNSTFKHLVFQKKKSKHINPLFSIYTKRI